MAWRALALSSHKSRDQHKTSVLPNRAHRHPSRGRSVESLQLACAAASLCIADLHQGLRTNCTSQMDTTLIQPDSLSTLPKAQYGYRSRQLYPGFHAAQNTLDPSHPGPNDQKCTINLLHQKFRSDRTSMRAKNLLWPTENGNTSRAVNGKTDVASTSTSSPDQPSRNQTVPFGIRGVTFALALNDPRAFESSMGSASKIPRSDASCGAIQRSAWSSRAAKVGSARA